MSGDRDESILKWHSSEIYQVSDVEEAVALAERFKQEGRYNWFRGQVKPWPPLSSLARVQLKDAQWELTLTPKIERYNNFLQINRELEQIAADRDAFFAVAQHYGIPTSYIDFSTEPAIAGYFACDTEAPALGEESCIYCLNIEDLKEAWDTLRTLHPNAEVDFVQLSVPNLWRLESQHGVFLYVTPGNWEVWYEMDQIRFPYRGYPPYPPKEVIYPVNKSSLEILLDHFFMNERLIEGAEFMRQQSKEIGAPFIRFESPPDNYHPQCFKGGVIEVHPSWSDNNRQKWADVTVEHFHELPQREIKLQVDPEWSPEETLRRVEVAAAGAIRVHPRLRETLVNWRFGERALGAVSSKGNSALEQALSWLWDGMRRLPYTDAQVATAVGRCVELYRLGAPANDRTVNRKIADRAFGSSLYVEFGGAGSYSRAYASREALLRAMPDDLAGFVADEYVDILGDPEHIFHAIFSPQRLFDFDRLCAIFPEQILPWQVLTRTGSAAYFSPSRLSAFGLP
jgi:hypothetical protein